MPSINFHAALSLHCEALGIVGHVDPMVATVPGDEPIATLQYSAPDAYAASVSANVEAFRVLDGFTCVESWTDAAMPLSVHLRYTPAPRVEVSQPIAPVPAPSSRRR
jgi:hypothetical protein